MSAFDTPIIVTRAEPGAGETVQRLQALGCTVLRAPALTLFEKSDTRLLPENEISGLVFTSANGVRAYAARRDDREVAAWCVGPATAEAAKLAGFNTIHESAGNAVDLAHFIAAARAPSNAPLLHVANAAAAGNLKRELETLGFSVAFTPLYEMRPATRLPDVVLEHLKRELSVIVLTHSAKGAEAFANLIEGRPFKTAALVAISEPASAPLTERAPNQTFIADAPNEDGLLRALKRALATLSA